MLALVPLVARDARRSPSRAVLAQGKSQFASLPLQPSAAFLGRPNEQVLLHRRSPSAFRS